MSLYQDAHSILELYQEERIEPGFFELFFGEIQINKIRKKISIVNSIYSKLISVSNYLTYSLITKIALHGVENRQAKL